MKTRGPDRRLPSDAQIRALMIQYPWRSDAEWARRWGCHPSRVTRLRKRVGVPPLAKIRKVASAFVRETSNGRGA